MTGQEYQCYHNLVLAHAKASVIFRSKYPPTEYPNKWIGLTNSGKVQLSTPESGSMGAMASDWWAIWEMGVYLDPIFNFDYPAEMKPWLKQHHGIEFTEEDKALLRQGGRPDYFAVQYYNFDLMISSVYCDQIDQELIQRMQLPENNVMQFVEMPFEDCISLCAANIPNATNTERIGVYRGMESNGSFCIYNDNSKFFWPSANPSHPVELQMGLYNFIAWGQLRYEPRTMLVTENGYPDEDSGSGYHTKDSYPNCGRLSDPHGGGKCGGCSFSDINDMARVIFYREHVFQAARAAMELPNISFKAFYAWSMFDNLEWCDGFRLRFGITCVDYTSFPKLSRHYKASALWFQSMFK